MSDTSKGPKREHDDGEVPESKRQKSQELDHGSDQFDEIFNDPLPFTSSNNQSSGGNNGGTNQDHLDIDFDNLPHFLDEPSNQQNNRINQKPSIEQPPVKTENLNVNRPIPNNPVLTLPPVSHNPISFPMGPVGNTTSNNINNVKAIPHTDDTSKLNDAIAAAGVDIHQEEELLLQQQLNRRSDVSNDLKQYLKASKPPAFLNPYHTASFMNKVARENGVYQNFLQDGELLELISASCENWIANILTKTVVLSRHRRRGVPNLTSKNKKGTNAANIPRSELSKEIRNLASKQKELEERRVAKRILLGLEKSASDPTNEDVDGKAGAEETLHRAANATAAMMTMNPGRKKYSWMTSNSGANEVAKAGAETDGKGKQSTIISVRGDNGLRFREIRSGNLITLKDLLGVIEDERMGTEKAIIKGYAKLKD